MQPSSCAWHAIKTVIGLNFLFPNPNIRQENRDWSSFWIKNISRKKENQNNLGTEGGKTTWSNEQSYLSSPGSVVPLPPPPQLPLICTTVTEESGMPGSCIPRVRILRWCGGRGCPGLFFSALSPEGRLWDGQREWCSQVWAHLFPPLWLRRLKKGLL